MARNFEFVIGDYGYVSPVQIRNLHGMVKDAILQMPDDFFKTTYGEYITSVFNFIKPFINHIPGQNRVDLVLNDMMVSVDVTILLFFISVARKYLTNTNILVIMNSNNKETYPLLLPCEVCNQYKYNSKLGCLGCGRVDDMNLVNVQGFNTEYYHKQQYALTSNSAIKEVQIKTNILKLISKLLDTSIVQSEHVALIRQHVGDDVEDLNCYKLTVVVKQLGLPQYSDYTHNLLVALLPKKRIELNKHLTKILKMFERIELLQQRYRCGNGRASSSVASASSSSSRPLNLTFKLFKVLQMCGVKCFIGDLMPIKNQHRVLEYENRWRQLMLLHQ
jgi:hypothetical protein